MAAILDVVFSTHSPALLTPAQVAQAQAAQDAGEPLRFSHFDQDNQGQVRRPAHPLHAQCLWLCERHVLL